MALPSQARIVIVGGGIAGCSTAYHLSLLGERDVLVLEQGELTCGTTWHAAGLVGQMRPNRNMTAMSKYGIELYATLEAETGLATGWKQCGSVNVARTPERMQTFASRSRWRAASASSASDQRRAKAGEPFRCCAPTTSRARSGSRATARRTRRPDDVARARARATAACGSSRKREGDAVRTRDGRVAARTRRVDGDAARSPARCS
jgi:glycine/D-amino acid oxidase-like deaminating enzyme